MSPKLSEGKIHLPPDTLLANIKHPIIIKGLRIPVQFSPNQAYVIEFKMKSALLEFDEPTLNFDIVEASGTITL